MVRSVPPVPPSDARWPPQRVRVRRQRTPLGADGRTEEAMANAISVALAEVLQDLATHDHDFRVGMRRAVRAAMTHVAALKAPRMWQNLVPGFTLLALPIGTAADGADSDGEAMTEAEAIDAPTARAAAAALAESFLARTGAELVALEADNGLLVLFPVSDVRRNLEEWGLYIRETVRDG